MSFDKVLSSDNIGRIMSTLLVIIAIVSIYVYSSHRPVDDGDAESSTDTGNAPTTTGAWAKTKRSKKKTGMMGLQVKRGESTVPVQISRVAQQRVEEFRHATCNLEAEKEVSIVAKTSDRIMEIFVEEGDSVKEGQTLARIDDERARMAADQARVRYENAKLELERAKQTYEKGISSDEEYQTAKLQYDTAKIDHEQRELELKYTSIKAPFDGIITNRRIEIGDHVSVNQEVFTIADLDPLLARIYLPETEWNKIEVGQPTRVTVDALADREFVGRVQRISPIVERETGTFKVTVEVHDKENLLRPGMLAKVFVITDSRENAFVIPKKALVLESENDEVFVLKDYVKFAVSQRTAERISVGDRVELKVENPEKDAEGAKTPPSGKRGKFQPKSGGLAYASPPPRSAAPGVRDPKKGGARAMKQSPSTDPVAAARAPKPAPASKRGTPQTSTSQKERKGGGPWAGQAGHSGKPMASVKVSGGRTSEGGPQDPTKAALKPKPGDRFLGSVYDVALDDPDPETGKITVVFEINETLLFSIDPAAQSRLADLEVPPELTLELKKRGFPFSHQASVSTEEKGGPWLITDSSSKHVYVVRRGEDKLNVYAKRDETGLETGMRMSAEVTPKNEEKTVRIPPGDIQIETKAFKRKIKLGFDESDPVEIKEGLALDERIITVGHEDLREGTAVTVVGEEALIAKAKAEKKKRAQETPKAPPGGMRRPGRPSPEQIKMFLKMRVGDPQFQEGLLKIEKVKKDYDEKLKADASLATDPEKRKAFFSEMLDKHIKEILEALRKMRGPGRGRGRGGPMR